MNQRSDGRYEKAKRINGKTIHFYSAEESRRKAERDIEEQILKYISKSADENKSKIKFREVAESWERQKREEITTWDKSYRGAFSELVSCFGEYNINDIKPEMVINYFNELRRKKYGLKTVSNRKSILNMIFNYAFISGKISNNFIGNIPLPGGLTKKPRKMPTNEEIDIVKKNCTGEDFLLYFLAYTGLRISEACALTDKDFDFENKLISVNKKITWVGNKPNLVHETKTEAGNRQVPLLSALINAMPKFKGYLFSNDNGKSPLTESQIRDIGERYNRKHNTHITYHQLRHAYAALCIEADLSVKELQYVMGHSDIHTTMDIYAEIRDKQKREIYNKLDTVSY